jgi:peptidoglycan hydrolase CwlO-like protein
MSQKFLTQIDMQNNQVVGLPATQTANDQATSKAHVDSAISTAISNLVDAAPGLLDTLNELAAAIGDDENFATTITNSINNLITDLSTADNSAKGATLVGIYDPDNKISATTVNAALIELKDAIGSSGTDISDLLTEISNARGGSPDLDTRLDGIDSTVSGIDGRVTSTEGDISTLQSDLSNAENSISDLQTDVSAAEGNISTLQSDLGAVETEISNARGGSVDLDTRLDGIDSTVSGIDGRVTSAEGNISTLQSDLDAAEGDISTLQTDLGAVETEISNARGGSVDLDTRLDGIDTSVSNLDTNKTDKHSADLGDGSATSFTINHALNTRDVVVTVRENSSPYAAVITDVEITSTTSVTVKFATAPSNNQYRIIIVG